jgi:hypothetical protein
MEFDFKITTWERVIINDEEDQKKVFELIKTGEITSANDIWNKGLGELAEYSILPDVSKQMTLEENGGRSTIEVLDNGETLYENGK